MCDTVGAPMCAVCENLGIIKIVFFLDAASSIQARGEIVARISAIEAQLQDMRAAGTCIEIIHKYSTRAERDACVSLECLEGGTEALRQVFGLEPDGEWR